MKFLLTPRACSVASTDSARRETSRLCLAGKQASYDAVHSIPFTKHCFSKQEDEGWHNHWNTLPKNYMGGVDKGDQLHNYYRVLLKSWKYVFCDTAITNALLYVAALATRATVVKACRWYLPTARGASSEERQVLVVARVELLMLCVFILRIFTISKTFLFIPGRLFNSSLGSRVFQQLLNPFLGLVSWCHTPGWLLHFHRPVSRWCWGLDERMVHARGMIASYSCPLLLVS